MESVLRALLLATRAADTLTYRFPLIDRLVNDLQLVLVENGEPLEDRMRPSHLAPLRLGSRQLPQAFVLETPRRR